LSGWNTPFSRHPIRTRGASGDYAVFVLNVASASYEGGGNDARHVKVSANQSPTAFTTVAKRTYASFSTTSP
jgi:hypothetical protein